MGIALDVTVGEKTGDSVGVKVPLGQMVLLMYIVIDRDGYSLDGCLGVICRGGYRSRNY